jgi:hypothetical protein
MRETNSYYSFSPWQQKGIYNVQGRYPPVQQPYPLNQQPYPYQTGFEQMPIHPSFIQNNQPFNQNNQPFNQNNPPNNQPFNQNNPPNNQPFNQNNPPFMNSNGGISPVNQYGPYYSPMTANQSFGPNTPPNASSASKNYGSPFQKAPSNYLLQSFKSENGSMDYQKMMNTAGQFMGTMSQIQSMFKGIGSVFKGV